MSGGQAQRLSIACALAHDPELVFLDEPTTGLDPQARRNLWDLLRDINGEGRTVVLTTHYLDEAEILCDRVSVMDHGKVLKTGTPAALVREIDDTVRVSVESGQIGLAAVRELRRGRPRPPPSRTTAPRSPSPPAPPPRCSPCSPSRRPARPGSPRRHPGGRLPPAHRTGVPRMSADHSDAVSEPGTGPLATEAQPVPAQRTATSPPAGRPGPGRPRHRRSVAVARSAAAEASTSRRTAGPAS